MKFDRPEQQIQPSWEINADAWIHAIDQNQIESRRAATDEAILQAVLRYGPRRVLDVGCGEGWLTRALANRGVEVVGVDGCAALIELVRKEAVVFGRSATMTLLPIKRSSVNPMIRSCAIFRYSVRKLEIYCDRYSKQ